MAETSRAITKKLNELQSKLERVCGKIEVCLQEDSEEATSNAKRKRVAGALVEILSEAHGIYRKLPLKGKTKSIPPFDPIGIIGPIPPWGFRQTDTRALPKALITHIAQLTTINVILSEGGVAPVQYGELVTTFKGLIDDVRLACGPVQPDNDLA